MSILNEKQTKRVFSETFATIVELSTESRKFLKEVVGLAMQGFTIDNCHYILNISGRDPDSINNCLGFDILTGEQIKREKQPDPADIPKEIENEDEDQEIESNIDKVEI